MNRKIFLGLVLVTLLGVTLAFTLCIQPVEAGTIVVPDNYSTIQEAINHANIGDTIFVRSGTYYEHIVIDKTLTLMGQDRDTTVIDGGYTDPASIVNVVANNVMISGFTLQHCRSGGNALWIDNYGNMIFSDNIITGCNEGVRLHRSSGNVVSYNIVQDCYYNTGVGIDYGINNIVQGNTIINNHYGLSGGVDCHGSTFLENTIINNDIGFGTTSYDNKFYHNNFVNNGVQVIASGVNQFDDGYPSGGNYWSDYAGVDAYHGPSQDVAGSDGIGDTAKPIDTNNIDHYPLMNAWSAPPVLYQLTVTSTPLTGIPFTINAVSKTTPYTESLLEGYYTIEMPQTYNGYKWSKWLEDGNTSRVKTIYLHGTTWTGVYVQVTPPVGGEWSPIDTVKVVVPWITLASLAMVALTSFVYVRHKKKQQN